MRLHIHEINETLKERAKQLEIRDRLSNAFNAQSRQNIMDTLSGKKGIVAAVCCAGAVASAGIAVTFAAAAAVTLAPVALVPAAIWTLDVALLSIDAHLFAKRNAQAKGLVS